MADSLADRLRADYEGRQVGPPFEALDTVNEAMIRHWCEAMGDRNPIYTDTAAGEAAGHGGIVAPPTMLQAWTMRGLRGRPVDGRSAQDELLAELDEAGFTSVVATNCEQEYARYVRPGERLSVSTTIESISDEKRTGLGVGHFVTTRQEFRSDDGELVGTMLFRILKFAPPAKAEAKPKRPRPAITKDTAFWFEGAKAGKVLIQRCASCGRLRHPPGPMCPECRSLDWDTVESSGRGTVHSYTVNHHPQVPAFDYPLVVVLVELEEGVRLISNLLDVDPADVEIGMPVEAELVAVDDDLTLPLFRKK